jgi:beta-fructofuranosidase
VENGYPLKQKPQLTGNFWLVGKSPALAHLLPKDEVRSTSPHPLPYHECVDHHLFQSRDGKWHVWGCIRDTAVGRILYHWEGESLVSGPWQETGEFIRADHRAGESLEDWWGEEWIQSPFVVKDRGKYHMFYGGHGTGTDAQGQPVPFQDPRMDCQICLMVSDDGRNWVRYQNENGQSRLFTGPGETRDPCVIRIGDSWVMYYTGYHAQDLSMAGIYARTSADLVHWSDWRIVHHDLSENFGSRPWNTECPHVVYRRGYYYLFRTEDYAQARTHVFRSQDPFYFGIGNALEYYIGPISVAAPEIILDENGDEYITSNHDLPGGTQLCRLTWVKDE